MRKTISQRFVVVLAAVGLLGAGCSDFVDSLPQLRAKDLRFRPPQSSKVFAADGSLITTFHGEQNRTVVPMKRIPKVVQKAVVGIEDQRFYQHDGVDLKAIARAAVANLSSGTVEEGGSTITQQYVKQTIIAPGRIAAKTYSRKIQEAALARQIEGELSKKEILERYLNTIYFGQGAYGVQAAARTFFAKGIGKVNLTEAALLAGIIQQPGAFDPFANPRAAKRRRNTVLNKMRQLGYASPARVARSRKRPLGVVGRKDDKRYPAPYFVDYVQRLLTYDPRFKVLGDNVRQRTRSLFQGGLRIYTTVDLNMQRAAEAAIAAYLPNETDPFGSLAAVEPDTGYVRALVGGRDYFATGKGRNGKLAKVNLAISGEPGLGPKRIGGEAPGEGRQAGSAFKPFTLAAAIEKGVPLTETYDASNCIDLSEFVPGYAPCNYEGSSFGSASVLQATINSINVVYLQLGLEVGVSATTDMAARLGIRTGHGKGKENHLEPVVSAPLGPNPVNPLDMASAFSTFANEGRHHAPVAVTRIYDTTKDKVVWEDKSTAKQVIDERVAAIVTGALEQVISSGTGVAAQIGRPAAGKTGTGQEYRDTWFVGYTPDLSTAVWVGHPEGEIAMPGLTGGEISAPIWGSFMSQALASTPVSSFDLSAGLVYRTIDTRTGCLADSSTPSEYAATTTFTPGTEPTVTCPVPTAPSDGGDDDDDGGGGDGNRNGGGNDGGGNDGGGNGGGGGNGTGGGGGNGNGGGNGGGGDND